MGNHIDFIFSSEGEIELELEDTSDDSDPDENEVQRVPSSSLSSPVIPTKVNEKEQQPQEQLPEPTPKYSFNIFDGTQDASGAFAAFIYDGDSDDEQYDQLQTDRWSTVQDYV